MRIKYEVPDWTCRLCSTRPQSNEVYLGKIKLIYEPTGVIMVTKVIAFMLMLELELAVRVLPKKKPHPVKRTKRFHSVGSKKLNLTRRNKEK